MIKLIASDLDGTLLLPDGKGLPPETFPLIEELHKKDILFVPASGRQLPNLMQMFAPVLDKIALIAENGGLAWYAGNTVFCDPTPPGEVRYALSVIAQERDLYPLCSCDSCAYYESSFQPFIAKVQASYSSSQQVVDLSKAIEGKTVLKISVWDPLLSAEHGGKILPDKIKGLRTIVSGRDWLDVCVLHANKGRALQALLNYFHLEKQQCMAFGDHMNDLELLQTSGVPYVTANAFAGLKAHFPHEVKSCAEKGVIEKCKELL